jgi:predicted phosphodiesterase
MSRTLVVGDIHGCYDELIDMLEAVGLGTDDRVVCVGDLVTKGPKNREVLKLFMTDARFRTVVGNHDLALRRKWHGEKLKLKASQKATHKELKSEKETYLPFLNKLPFTIDLGTHLVVHAGFRPGIELY